MKKMHILTILATILLIATACDAWSWNYSIHEEPNLVAEEFTLSLIENHSQRAYSLTTETRRSTIDTWMEEHEKFKCSAPIWAVDDVRWLTFPSYPPLVDASRELYSVVYMCARTPFYMFRIDDISLVKTDRGWLVDDWGEICEARDSSSCD